MKRSEETRKESKQVGWQDEETMQHLLRRVNLTMAPSSNKQQPVAHNNTIHSVLSPSPSAVAAAESVVGEGGWGLTTFPPPSSHHVASCWGVLFCVDYVCLLFLGLTTPSSLHPLSKVEWRGGRGCSETNVWKKSKKIMLCTRLAIEWCCLCCPVLCVCDFIIC